MSLTAKAAAMKPRNNKIWEDATTLLTKRPLQTLKIICEHGPITGLDINENHRSVTGEALPLHTYLNDLCVSGWIQSVGRAPSKVNGKQGKLWDITGAVGVGLGAAAQIKNKRLSANNVVSSIIGFAKFNGQNGCTYHEWWAWFQQNVCGVDLEFRSNDFLFCCWKDAQRANILVPTDMSRSQRDVETDPNIKTKKSARPAQVWLLRDEATIVDYINADKRALRERDKAHQLSLTSAETAILSEFRQLQKRWPKTQTDQQRERLLLKLTASALRAVQSVSK